MWLKFIKIIIKPLVNLFNIFCVDCSCTVISDGFLNQHTVLCNEEAEFLATKLHSQVFIFSLLNGSFFPGPLQHLSSDLQFFLKRKQSSSVVPVQKTKTVLQHWQTLSLHNLFRYQYLWSSLEIKKLWKSIILICTWKK